MNQNQNAGFAGPQSGNTQSSNNSSGSGRRTWLMIGLVILAVIALLFVGSLFLGSSGLGSGNVTNVDGVNFNINYPNSTSSYFGPSSQILNSSLYNYTIYNNTEALDVYLPIKNNGTMTHTITGISLSPSTFAILNITPSLPYSISPGGSAVFEVISSLPNNNFTGIVTVHLSTT